VWVIAFGELFFGGLWCVVWGYGGMRTHFSLLNPDMRSKDFPFTQACELAAAEIVQHAFTHDGNPLLSEHVRNAQRHLGRYGETVRKESRASQKKIDAAVCMIGARMVYRMVKSDPSLKAEPVDDTAFFY
ncbi:hypothetical protein JY504_08020, partial [Corynebacterium amycolatum]|uniref:phage terminase family protein n=1 Tax=Corynebacterium amycolatum TaxID=43765 RepID=UPI00211A462C|nr:hypothetical protein [Corynebacterium amycolatum]